MKKILVLRETPLRETHKRDSSRETPRERLLAIELLVRDSLSLRETPPERLFARDSLQKTPQERLLARDSSQETPCKRLLARDSLRETPRKRLLVSDSLREIVVMETRGGWYSPCVFALGDNKQGNENLILPWRLVQFLCFHFGDNKKRNKNLILPLVCWVTM